MGMVSQSIGRGKLNSQGIHNRISPACSWESGLLIKLWTTGWLFHLLRPLNTILTRSRAGFWKVGCKSLGFLVTLNLKSCGPRRKLILCVCSFEQGHLRNNPLRTHFAAQDFPTAPDRRLGHAGWPTQKREQRHKLM